MPRIVGRLHRLDYANGGKGWFIVPKRAPYRVKHLLAINPLARPGKILLRLFGRQIIV